MPEPQGSGQRYMPGLDGLRAIAVLAVIAYHEQFGWAPGGLLGVAVFFTLSGYLITDLLLAQWVAGGRIKLRQFWVRRARRLLPALFVMLAVVTAWVTIVDRSRLASLRGPVLAALTYTSNWYLIIKNQSYFARFAPPQPLDHLWSLAVEEQFYLLWPWLLLLALLLLRRLGMKSVKWLAIPSLVLAAGSALLMFLLYQPGLDPTRIYEGTDTRACGLLVGAALAMIWPSREGAKLKRRVWAVDVAAAGGLAVVFFMIARVGQYSPFIYKGGLAVLSVATAAILAAGAVPGSLVGRVLAWAPLRWLGVRSYGIYLWHYPVIVLSSPANSTEDLPRAAIQVAVSIALAALSWKFVEEPVRRGAIGKQLALIRSSGWRPYLRSRAMIATTSMAGVVAVACVGLAGLVPFSGSASASGPGTATRPAVAFVPSAPSEVSVRPRPGAAPAITGLTPLAGSSAPSTASKPLTSCTSVVHIGDSTSEGMIMTDYIPDAALRLQAQYHDVGVKHVITEISGARSIVEVLPGQTNGYNVARNLVRSGYSGCWVIALGTNDTANVAIGSSVSRAARIAEMMSVTRGEPVMWVNVRSLLDGGPYAEANMELWDEALLHACSRYPNMRIYDWASVVHQDWYISDGIHFTSQGYIARGHDIARALAAAFPLHGQSTGCVVR
ncbi:MAG TPA: acyltransferase family protein [Streptosporangiaceae bacterium]|nr:acyltransferase family protein [Streptosporangiaceae bacterium]